MMNYNLQRYLSIVLELLSDEDYNPLTVEIS